MKKQASRIIGYYESEDVIRPIFENLSIKEFRKKYPGRTGVLPEHLANDEDYVPARTEKK